MAAVLDSLTIVLPAFQEEARLGPSLDTLFAWLDQYAPAAEVVVVDDGSRDGTAAVVQARAAREPRLRLAQLGQNRGKGAAVRRGVELARGNWILLSDADLSTPITELAKLVAAVEAGADIAIGSRDVRDSQIVRHQPAYRELMGRVFNQIVQAAALPGLRDTQCGFKLFSAEAARRCFALQTIERFAFDVEVLYVARRLGYRIAEVGVVWVNDERSTVRPIRDASRMFADVVRIRRRHRGLGRAG